MRDRSAHTARAGFRPSRPRCSVRQTASRSTSAPCRGIPCCGSGGSPGSSGRIAAPRRHRSTSESLMVELEAGLHLGDRRQDAEAERGAVEIEIADRLDEVRLTARPPPRPRAAPHRAARRRSRRSCRRERRSGRRGRSDARERCVSRTVGSGWSTTGIRTAAGRTGCSCATISSMLVVAGIARGAE